MKEYILVRFDEQPSKDGVRIVSQVYTLSNNDFIGTIFIQGGNTQLVTIFDKLPQDVMDEIRHYEDEVKNKTVQIFDVDIQYVKHEFIPEH